VVYFLLKFQELNHYLNFGPDGWNKYNNSGHLYKCKLGFCPYRLAGNLNIPLAVSAPRPAKLGKAKRIYDNWYSLRGEITLIGDGEPDTILCGVIWGTAEALAELGHKV
jgi:hypothetical protein